MRIFSAISDEDTFRCGRLKRMREPLAMSCELTAQITEPEGNILLVGNSHANMIKDVFTRVAQQLHYRVRFLVPNDPLMKGGIKPAAVIEEALRTKATSIVLHYSPDSISPDTIKELVELADHHKLPVKYITPVPVWNTHIPIALWRNLKFGEPLPVLTIRDYKMANATLLTALNSIHKESFGLYDAGVELCKTECAYQDASGRPYYLDNHHLTLTGSEQLKDLVHRLISDLH